MLAIGLCGCGGTAWTLQDRSGSEVVFRKARLEGGGLTLLDGTASRHVPLKKVDSLLLDPGRIREADGSLFYGARLVLTDGTRIPTRDSAGAEKGSAFASVDGSLRGKTSAGGFSIGLADVRTLWRTDTKPAPEPEAEVDKKKKKR